MNVLGNASTTAAPKTAGKAGRWSLPMTGRNCSVAMAPACRNVRP